VAAAAAFLCGCTPVDCSTTESSLPAPGERAVAIERVISCGGAAGSLDEEVLLAPAIGEPETLVVATTGPVYSLRWRNAETLIVEVDAIDEYGDAVSEYVESWNDVRVVLVRRT
jgi:hypothetical protein